MKRTLITSAAIALTLMQGCERPQHIQENGKTVKVRFDLLSMDQSATRLTDLGNESAIAKAKLFIYTSDGKYITSLDGTATAEIDLYEGNYAAAAFANTPDDITNGNIAMGEGGQLETTLENNSIGNLVMFGEHSFDVSGNGTSVTIPVRRTVAKISVNEILNRMKDPVHQTMEFVIRRIFVSNVSAVSDLSGNNSPISWYNKNGIWADESPTVKAFLEDNGIDISLPYQDDYSQSHSFYVYPNDIVSDSYEAEWSPRFTRLVIEASFDGDICYYPIPIGGIESNHTYTINRLTITKPGTDNPWENVDGESCSFTITVTDWEEGLTTDKTI